MSAVLIGKWFEEGQILVENRIHDCLDMQKETRQIMAMKRRHDGLFKVSFTIQAKSHPFGIPPPSMGAFQPTYPVPFLCRTSSVNGGMPIVAPLLLKSNLKLLAELL